MESCALVQLEATEEKNLLKDEEDKGISLEQMLGLEKIGVELESDSEYDFVEESVETDKENELEHSPEYAELVHWRINFRTRNHVPSDHIFVDTTSSTEESSSKAMNQFLKGPDGEVLAKYFQFCHELKNTTYKNKYTIRLDAYKMTFSERDDSILIRSDGDSTVHMGISNNTLFRNRNMAIEELRNMLSQNIRVYKSLFVTNRSQQMGEMDLSKCVSTITAENLTVVMDSFPNIIEIVKLHRPMLNKFTLMCSGEYGNIMELEQVRNAANLKLDGLSKITDDQLNSITATNFEITSNIITDQGINRFIKARLADDIPDNYFASVGCRHGNWKMKEVLSGLKYTAYDDEMAYVRKNGMIPINVFEADLVSLPTTKPNERLVVIINKYYFECFKESMKPDLLVHDTTQLP